MSDKKSERIRFRDFLRQHGKLSLTENETRMGREEFMVGLGMFAFFYAILTAPDFIPQSYVSPYASKILLIGFVFAIWTALRWERIWAEGQLRIDLKITQILKCSEEIV